MTKKELAKLARRALAVNPLLWSLEGITYIPLSALSVSHYVRIEMKSATQEYYFRYYLILSIARVVISSHWDLQVRTNGRGVPGAF